MRLLAVLVIAFFALGLNGCASVTTAQGKSLRIGSDAFADYAEGVFREQNRIASRIAFALADLDETSGARYDSLTHAEDALLDACAGLNEVAARVRDGLNAGALRGLRAAREAPACERATTAAEDVLGNPASRAPASQVRTSQGGGGSPFDSRNAGL